MLKTIGMMVDEIEVHDRARPLDENAVSRLADSIRDIGLQTPLSIVWHDDPETEGARFPVLVAGRHRLEACKRLGIDSVPVFTFKDHTLARKWEIAENLHRADLTALQRSEHVAEWVKLTEEKTDGASCADSLPDGRKAGPQHQQRGINAAVRELGIDRTEAQRSVKIAALPNEAKEAARDLGLDKNQSALLAATKAPAAEAAAVIRDIAERKSVKPVPAPLNDIETEDQWRNGMMRLWNRAPDEWRERFIDYVQSPVFDNTRLA